MDGEGVRPGRYSRRAFLGSAGLLGAATVVGPHVIVDPRNGIDTDLRSDFLRAAAKTVNVRSFGAIGFPISITGTVESTKLLKVTSTKGWRVGSGIGLRAVTAPTTGVTEHSFKTQIAVIHSNRTLVPAMEFPRNLVGKLVTVTSDDALPIQAAIDSLGSRGGTVIIPAGTYTIGTPGYWNNQALSIGSHTSIIGAGATATVLRLCDEANVPVPHGASVPPEPTSAREATNGDYGLGAGPMLVNKSNPWYRPTSREVDYRPSWYGLPHDSDIKISRIGADGNQNYQSVTFEPMFRPSPALVPDLAATQSVEVNEGTPADLDPPSAPGNLVAGVTYTVYVRYMDGAGIEGPPSNPAGLVLDSDGDALVVTIPPLSPSNAESLVVYVSGGEPLNAYGDIAFERNQVIAPIPQWDLPTVPPQMPLPSSWPTITVLNHTPYDPSNPTPETSYRLPGLLGIGESTAGNFTYLYNVESLELSELNLSNFVVDAITLSNVQSGVFSSISMTNNGRDGVSLGQQFNRDIAFTRCTFMANGQSGIDMEDQIACNGVKFTECIFVDNESAGVSIGVLYDSGNPPAGNPVENVTLSGCEFSGNFRQIFVNASGPNTPVIGNLLIDNCTFEDTPNRCIWIYTDSATVPITGTISGCTFNQAAGQPPTWGPAFDVGVLPNGSPCVWLVGAPIVFNIVGNTFTPFGAVTSIPSPPAPGPASYMVFSDQAMIDVSLTSGGHTIKDNVFTSNVLDVRPEAILLASAPAQLANNVYLQGLTRDWFGGGEQDQGWKHQWLLAADQNNGTQDEFPILSSCAISGNTGDGYIVANPTMPTDNTDFQNICGLALSESQSNVPLTEGATSLEVYVGSPNGFQAQLPGTWSIPSDDPAIPAEGAYAVSVTFTDFDPGLNGWTLTDQGPNGFAIAWDNPVPAATESSTPQISWSASFMTA
jgi:hypothetical protein